MDLDYDAAAIIGSGLLAGAIMAAVLYMGQAMMPVMHPLVRAGNLENTGPFALSMGTMIALGFLRLHLLFGLLVGVFYSSRRGAARRYRRRGGAHGHSSVRMK